MSVGIDLSDVYGGDGGRGSKPVSAAPGTDLFDTAIDVPDAEYEAQVIQWISTRCKEGEDIIKDEPGYDEIDKSISFIMGDQFDQRRPNELSNTPDNRSKNILNQTVAALTDIHPLFGFDTKNPNFKDQADVLVKLSQCWWINNDCDLKLADVIKYAAGVGTGYCEVAWDSSAAQGAGDIVLRPLDPRDVLPIRPKLGGSIQDWDGVIMRVAKSPEELKVRFPDKAHRIFADNQPSIVARTWSKARKIMSAVVTPSAVDVANNSNARNTPKRVPTCDVHTVYLRDRRLHVGSQPLIMGDPLTTWSYTVYPVGWTQVPNGTDKDTGQPKFRKANVQDCKLYPRGRMILATKKTVLYDGPNPYWHGMFPICRLSLDPWPWSLLGCSVMHDLMPLQESLNETLNGILDHIRKLLRPAVVADKKAVANSIWERMDTRLPGMKLKTNSVAGKTIDIVSPQPLPEYTFEVLKWIAAEMDYQAGTANLMALSQLQQAPGADTIEKMQEALSPVLRLKGRLMEYFLREMGSMVKANFFQFYNMPRRVAMLGEAGIVFNDFDFDPGTLVPALSTDDPGYTYEIDKSKSRSERGQWFHQNFTFTITPNSLLALSQISRKLMYMQLRSLGLVDRWTLYDVMEIPNGGAPPNDAQTITDRLMAEQMLFAPPAPPEGRPPTYQQSPTMLQKKQDDGVTPRQTVSSTGSGGGR